MSERALIPSKAAAAAWSFTPARFGTLQRKCSCGGSSNGGSASSGGECAECKKEEKTLQRRAVHDGSTDAAPPIVYDVLRSPGQPLDRATRAFMEPRFGHDFSKVRIHTDSRAAESARAVNAIAYTVGQNVVFGAGQHEPATSTGRASLAHELTHVVQQKGFSESPILRVGNAADPCEREAEAAASGTMDMGASRSVQPASELIQRQADESVSNTGSASSAVQDPQAPNPPSGTQTPTSAATSTEKPETCAAPPDMACPATKAPAAGVTNTLVFPVDSAVLNATQRAEVDAAAASWNSGGATGNVRVDGYASAEYKCDYNWQLSCRRAQAVAAELEHPSDGSKKVPSTNISLFAHGESDEAGAALAPNRRVTISMPVAPTKPVVPTPSPSPSPSPSVTCKLPASLGVGRTGCGTGSDFTHFDFPSISAASELKLAAWAAAHGATALPLIPLPGLPFRSLVPNAECELEMDAVLVGFARGAGHAAFSRFRAGTGGTETHSAGSTLGKDALVSGSFAHTLVAVKHDIESKLAIQAASGKLDPCALKVVPPATHFGVSDGMTLKAVIGGTHGERLNATAFTGDIPTRTYSIGLEFLICDNFGVDEADLYAPGLFAFWVLQHERSATLYAPFINLLDLPVTVSGTF
jgi:outer membrane protein OmpA-like peptidoglycan-associated protein